MSEETHPSDGTLQRCLLEETEPQVANFGSTNGFGYSRVNNFGIVNAQNFIIQNQRRPIEEIKPGSTVPFSRDDNFVARKGIFEQLDEALSPAKANRWAALYGLGGIGKSQLAIEYSYRARDLDPTVWIFWVSAANSEAFVRSFSVIAERLDIIKDNQSSANMLLNVSRWLSSESNESWFIILDNLDDIDVLHNAPQESDQSNSNQMARLIDYIPFKPHGRVLATSRDENTASTIVNDFKKIIKVEGMGEGEALQLLRSKVLLSLEDEEDARVLVSLLNYIPLAISQAGSYVHELRSMFTIKDYIQQFNESAANKVNLLKKQQQELRRDRQVPNSIIVAWEISFQQIKSKSPKAAELLCFLAMLHRQDIPLDLIKSDDLMQTWEDIRLLETYSFVTVSRPDKIMALCKDDRRLSLHSLVQLAIKIWLESMNLLTEQKNKAIEWVSKRFNVDYNTRKEWLLVDLLSTHVNEVLSGETNGEKNAMYHRADLLVKVALHELGRLNYEVSEARAAASVTLFRKYYDREVDHVRTSCSRETWASSLIGQDRYAEAEPVLKQVEENLVQQAGAENKQVLRVRKSLGRLYYYQGNLQAALKLAFGNYETVKTKNGPNDLITLLYMNDLAGIYRDLSWLDKAQAIQEHVFQGLRNHLGLDHPATLSLMANLATTYRKQGELMKAEELISNVLALKGLASKLPSEVTSTVLFQMSHICYEQGRFEEALPFLDQAIELSKKIHGPYHPKTLTLLGVKPSYLKHLKRKDEAEALDLNLVNAYTANLGPNHEDTLQQRGRLAINWWYDDKRQQALETLEEVVRLMVEHLGDTNRISVTWERILDHCRAKAKARGMTVSP